jgi:hypothetical protein
MATLNKLTSVVIVDAIEPALPSYEALGYKVNVRVPESGTLGFVIMAGPAGELMLQTRASLTEDLPEIAKRAPSHLLYGDVRSLDATKRALRDAKVLIKQRKTFYGATESWLELPGPTFLGLAEHAE